MSEALTDPIAPETDSAEPSVEDPSPGNGTAVAEGSVGEAETKTVEAARFNGLMSAHQRILSELETERAARAELEARINSQEETPEVADEAILSRLDAMEERAVKAERKAALAEVLTKYPDAAPFADLIVGSNVEDIENVAAAVSERAQALKGPGTVPAPVVEGEGSTATDGGDAADVAEAPVIGGGHSAPSEPSTNEAVQAALENGSWSEYWKAKSGTVAQANLG